MSLAYLPLEQLEPTRESRVLSEYPHIAIGGIGLYGYNLGQITEIQFGEGVMKVDKTQSPFREGEFPVLILSTLGLNADEIASITDQSPRTVRFHIRHALETARKKDAAIVSKIGFTRYYIEQGMYTPDDNRQGEPLGLTNAELSVFTLMSYGRNNKAVAKKLGVSPYTVDSHIQHAHNRTGLPKNEQIVLGTFLSREISL